MAGKAVAGDMGGLRGTHSLPSLAVLIGLPFSYLAAWVISIHLAQGMGGLMPLWVCSSIVLTALIRHPTRLWPVLVLLAASTEIAIHLVKGTGLGGALLFATVNVGGPLLIATGLRYLADGRPWYVSGRWFLSFILLAVGTASLTSLIGSIYYIVTIPGWPLFEAWREWVASDALGYLVVTPFLLGWTETALKRERSLRRSLEAVAMAFLVAGVSYFVFTSSLPLLFLVFPFLALITLRGGLLGATAGTLTFAGIAIWFQTRGLGPIATLPNLDRFELSLILQANFLTAALSTIPIAVITALREALTERLKQQDAISSAALNNMAQGLCMFDEQDRLIICNQRYVDLYNLPENLRIAGTPLIDLMRHNEPIGDSAEPEQHLRDLLAIADSKRPHSEMELPNGSIIEIQTRKLDHGWIATHEDATEKRRASHRITYLANHDPLTDLPNRSFFREKLQASLAFAERGHGFALHSLDLDRFKDVNDTLGHGVGDQLLKQVADRLRALVREGDFVTRLGGDEFGILQFPLETPEEASALAMRVVEALCEPFHIEGHDVVIGATVGIALAPEDASDAADLLQKSDLALYRAKADGRGTYRFFEVGMDAIQHARRALEGELRTAIRNGEFELYYQPILKVETGNISGFEALIRWRHPTRGLVEPGEFIGIAEDTGLILAIGEWVLREACREAAGWPDEIGIAVNLSPVQFKSRNLLATVTSALSTAGLAPGRLELEITESVLLQDTDTVLSVLHQLRSLGISIAMDDFGTGYSSLSYLRSFPFDKIKIDRSFITELAATGDGLAIVHATVELSGKLGMLSTAEGVETAEQYAILRAEGCTHIQGYYISQPKPASKVDELLNRYSRKGIIDLEQKVA